MNLKKFYYNIVYCSEMKETGAEHLARRAKPVSTNII
jgi:hypothetical protein